ncbi:MAG: protein-arginine deiminase family protein [Bdellovibrionota bacterium]
MRLRLIYIFYFIFISSLKSYAACPEWISNKSNLPLCPEKGQLVPETYPVAAVVVSDSGSYERDSQFASELVEKTLLAAGENPPLIVLPVSDATMERINNSIDSLKISEAKKKKFKALLQQVPVKSYTWQKDYMQAFVNPQSGQISLREVSNYSSAVRKNKFDKGSFRGITEASKKCGFLEGPPLTSPATDSLRSGHSAGNIGTLPTGICLLGSDNFQGQEWENYASEVCDKSPKNRIKVPTSWLQVGHTDEVIKVIRNKNNPAPCDFSITFASPNKALELLKVNPEGSFINFKKKNTESLNDTFIRRVTHHQGLNLLCRKKIQLQYDQKKNPSSQGVSQLLNLRDILLNKAFAESPALENCENLSNKDVYRILTEDSELKIYNQLIQEQIDNLKKDVLAKLQKALPACKIDALDVPNIFYGGQPVKTSKNKYILPHGMAKSFLPSPTNSVAVAETIISPEPANDIFRKYLQVEYEKRGLKSEFIDTFDYAHLGGGNLHCATNTIHICRPRN